MVHGHDKNHVTNVLLEIRNIREDVSWTAVISYEILYNINRASILDDFYSNQRPSHLKGFFFFQCKNILFKAVLAAKLLPNVQ